MNPRAQSADFPRRVRGEAVDTLILETARELLLANGYRGPVHGSRRGTDRSGQTTIYRLYRNKADLATAALAAYAEQPLEQPVSDDPRVALIAYMRRFRERMHAGGFGVLANLLVEHEDPEVLDLHRQRVIHPRVAATRVFLEDARDRGQIRPDADLDLALLMLVGSLFASQIAGLDDEDDWTERAVALAWEGMAPR